LRGQLARSTRSVVPHFVQSSTISPLSPSNLVVIFQHSKYPSVTPPRCRRTRSDLERCACQKGTRLTLPRSRGHAQCGSLLHLHNDPPSMCCQILSVVPRHGHRSDTPDMYGDDAYACSKQTPRPAPRLLTLALSRCDTVSGTQKGRGSAQRPYVDVVDERFRDCCLFAS
jgi:hypothetical protein